MALAPRWSRAAVVVARPRNAVILPYYVCMAGRTGIKNIANGCATDAAVMHEMRLFDKSLWQIMCKMVPKVSRIPLDSHMLN